MIPDNISFVKNYKFIEYRHDTLFSIIITTNIGLVQCFSSCYSDAFDEHIRSIITGDNKYQIIGDNI